jgi:hypothetical protein
MAPGPVAFARQLADGWSAFADHVPGDDREDPARVRDRGACRRPPRLRRRSRKSRHGGMVANEILMQFQADILGVPVIRPVVAETTALGAAYAAGLAVSFWAGEDDIRANWAEDKRWEPSMDDAKRQKYYRKWKKAVTKTFDWVDEDDD